LKQNNEFLVKLEHLFKEGKIPSKLLQTMQQFYQSYSNAIVTNGVDSSYADSIMNSFLELIQDQLKHPFSFEPYHEAIRHPFDYYQFGLDFIRPLVIRDSSSLIGLEYVQRMVEQLSRGENVILLANHQTEPDPQAISILLEKTYPKLGEEMIFVAGHRVISDPLAVPFSMGRNLLCIFSKKYIEHPPEQKQEKLLHNQKTMKRMSQLLTEGGKCIYVAPSGGRDRANIQGDIEVAPFDAQSLEMFFLMAKSSGRPTHFYTLALATYHLLPPPQSIRKELGENRHTKATPIHLCFGEEVDMEKFPECDLKDKRKRRQARADYIWNLVKADYESIK
jgi:glycerol-3-phosphate O-acyltransferase